MSFPTYGQEQDQEPTENLVQQWVEVELPDNSLAPYGERRQDHGSYFAISYEALDLQNYTSALDLKTYTELFGTEPVPLMRLTADYKYNFSLGALALGIEYGMGSLSDSLSGANRTLEVTKYGVGLKFIADNILANPFAAPYVGLNLWQMDLTESRPTDSFSETTEPGMNYTLGVLLQLDWIDPDSSKFAMFQWGLQNTFIDLYVTQYAATSGENDPDTETDLLYGGGLRLEF